MPKTTTKKTPAKKTTRKKTTVKKTPRKKTTRKKTATPSGSSRDVLYPEVEVRACRGEDSITYDQAKQLLGWTEVDGGDHLFQDVHGKKIRCTNNVTNRPLYKSNVDMLKQEHLRRRWRFNGEPIIIGQSGFILNGQHSLISLALAYQEWEKDPEKWAEFGEGPITMEKIIVFGVEEDDSVVNTMDTCKPRSLSDVIYRSEYFANVSAKDRRQLARVTEYAVKTLWKRTGADSDAFNLRRYQTHAESLDFIARHPKLLEAVKHIYEENGEDGRIQKLIGLGYASGLLYLMGCAGTDPTEYSTATSPQESMLDFGFWDKACDFFVLLSGGAKELKAVHNYSKELRASGLSSVDVKAALLAKAWNLYAEGSDITLSNLELQWSEDDDGVMTLAEAPTVGGIDSLDNDDTEETPPKKSPKKSKVETPELSPQEIRERAKRIRKGSKPPKEVAVGDTVWVDDPEGEPWMGDWIETNGNVARVEVSPGFAGAGTVYDVPIDQLVGEQPDR